MSAPTALLLALLALAQSRQLPEVPPAEVGLDASRLERIDGLIEDALAERLFPGAVVLVGKDGKIAFVRAYGRRAVEPADEPMTRDTLFDLASLTKPIATATVVAKLAEQGRLNFDDPVVRHLPAFDNHGKSAITIDQLLRHRAGLIPDNPLSDYADGPDRAWQRLAEINLVGPPGEKFVYSDVGFLLLGRLAEQAGGHTLDALSTTLLFDPLGMSDTRFHPASQPLDPARLARCAPTEKDGDRMLRGVVHDPRARALGGVAGHAGLFGSADDLALFAQMMLDEGRDLDGRSVLKPETVRSMTDPADTPEGQRRGLGWDIATGYSSPRGKVFGPQSYGHTGFTGTSLWIDPDTRMFVILLTSRLHPDGEGDTPGRLRGGLATLAAEALLPVPDR